MLRRGTQAVREAHTATGGGDGGADRRFIIRGGESVVMRVIGDFEGEEDPVLVTQHYIKRLGRGEVYQNCGDNTGQPCVFDYARSTLGDKGIGRSDRALFYIHDTGSYHKLDREVRVLKGGVRLKPGQQPRPDDYYVTKYPACAGPRRPCPYCKQGNEAQPQGYRYWELATGYADQLLALQADARSWCRCGATDADYGAGTIEVAQYLCAACQAPVEFSPEQGLPLAHCSACGRKQPPLEEVSCTAECGDPQRCDLGDFLVRVKRTGAGQQTAYNFELIQPPRLATPEEAEEAEKWKPDWEALAAPKPPEVQAALLGIPCPPELATGEHGAEEFPQGSMTVDDGQDPFAEDPEEPDEPPARPGRPRPPPASMPVVGRQRPRAGRPKLSR